MKVFELSLGTVVLRLYLMTLIVIVAGFIGQWWLAALALPVFLSLMSGVAFSFKRKNQANIKVLKQEAKLEKKAS